MDSHSMCPFCAQEEETANHILIDCVFARQKERNARAFDGILSHVPAVVERIVQQEQQLVEAMD
uniref:Reverse transcriptase zinc-binding domain-containing protein n=1 Tax=Oryza sativa subsp. japonica TaxID=39947 RepID=Q6YTX0_ORYSJ|nr:hypothetical protein [Oryza sativa Japonica Group]